MSQLTENFIEELVSKFSGLHHMFQEHVSDNFGELLPHLFFGDLTRYVVATYLAAQSGPIEQQLEAEREARALLAELEQAYALGGNEIEELIAVSFLENLPRPGEEGAGVREWLGPELTKQLRVIG